ncbi:cytosine deaminase [Pleurotus ostreatus]|uniref:Cytosine deaminase n=1 Tax=Pleurotus ostreatus TaxID=5322 RepID=A0A8H6ZMV4_PLEOS|nr:cytosine deaminase [Pleurotus ostreatus]KAF7419566.1 cytosine deaminase [Pleurotus ostreatus]
MESADQLGLSVAFQEAQDGYKEGGIPIGAALVRVRDGMADVLASGRNLRLQKSSATLHGETSALENAGRLPVEVYRECTMYTTLSMCSGAILLYKIPRVVIGENANFKGEEELLRSRGVDVLVVDDEACKTLMARFIKEKPQEWYEDIGEMY